MNRRNPPSLRRRAILARWSLVLAWMGVIFALSSIPGSRVPGRFGNAAHVAEYAVLGLLLVFALYPGTVDLRIIAVAVAIASLYGITDELHQFYVPGRVPDLADWGRDTLGACAGAVAAALAVRAATASRSAGRR
ncbi:MAG: VanZ family protein [Actinomycetota bacterium]|nr:VanZ family protein [Actinomycetota bacterium]